MTEPRPAAELRCPSCGAAAAEDAGTCGFCRATLAVVGCPRCFGHLFVGMRYCPRCGEESARAEEGTMDLPCPECEGPLTKVRVGVLTFGECGTCQGLWLDAELFGRLVDDQDSRAHVLRWHGTSAASLVAAPVRPVRYRPCPRCQKLMNRVHFARVSKVIVDVCKAHGTWFDRDELFRVVTFVQEGGLDRTRAVEHERTQEEQRRNAEQARMLAELRRDADRVDSTALRGEAGWFGAPRGTRSPLERFLEIFLS